ncbi:MAG: triosephosphate isomerase [Candidatus Binatota bacterium]|nr:triosephosphate isomerase [Candidatus Binatota bacterium]
MSRRPLIAGNWKMHGTAGETRALLSALLPEIAGVDDRDVAVAPPFTALPAAADELSGSTVWLTAQNVHWEAKGAFTGEISTAMLLDVGCRAAIVGHSERRQYFGETDQGVGRRARAALVAGLVPIVCVGETLPERESDRTLEVVERQLRAALLELQGAAIATVCIAYEPVWAIGTGKNATPTQAQEVHAAIRAVIARSAGDATANAMRILYGGSVKPETIDALMSERDVDGALVGGASLEARSFARIVRFG